MHNKYREYKIDFINLKVYEDNKIKRDIPRKNHLQNHYLNNSNLSTSYAEVLERK